MGLADFTLLAGCGCAARVFRFLRFSSPKTRPPQIRRNALSRLVILRPGESGIPHPSVLLRVPLWRWRLFAICRSEAAYRPARDRPGCGGCGILLLLSAGTRGCEKSEQAPAAGRGHSGCYDKPLIAFGKVEGAWLLGSFGGYDRSGKRWLRRDRNSDGECGGHSRKARFSAAGEICMQPPCGTEEIAGVWRAK